MQPGSQERERRAREDGTLPKGALHSNGERPECAGLVEGAKAILAEPGTVIVFDKDLVHAGGPNLSSAIRYALYARMRFEA